MRRLRWAVSFISNYASDSLKLRDLMAALKYVQHQFEEARRG